MTIGQFAAVIVTCNIALQKETVKQPISSNDGKYWHPPQKKVSKKVQNTSKVSKKCIQKPACSDITKVDQEKLDVKKRKEPVVIVTNLTPKKRKPLLERIENNEQKQQNLKMLRAKRKLRDIERNRLRKEKQIRNNPFVTLNGMLEYDSNGFNSEGYNEEGVDEYGYAVGENQRDAFEEYDSEKSMSVSDYDEYESDYDEYESDFDEYKTDYDEYESDYESDYDEYGFDREGRNREGLTYDEVLERQQEYEKRKQELIEERLRLEKQAKEDSYLDIDVKRKNRHRVKSGNSW